MADTTDLTSPYVTRVSSAASNATMEVISESWFEGDKKTMSIDTGGWEPPIIQRKEDAWQEGTEPDQMITTSQAHKHLRTEKWIDETISPPKPKENKHPVSQGTKDFLASLVTDMRGDLDSNTTVMSLLNKPVSVFDDPMQVVSRDVNVAEHDKMNKELEEFLLQIRHIRDGPPQQNVKGELAEEIETHLTKQKVAMEEALAVLERELTQDSGGLKGREAEQEEEYKRLVMERESTVSSKASSQTIAMSDNMSQISGNIGRSDSQCTITTQHTATDNQPQEEEEEEIPKFTKKMGLYELLALHPDQKVRKAAIRMKRLDDRLRLVIQKEKEVKRQRELLNKRMLLYNSGQTLIRENSDVDDLEDDDLTLITELKSDITPIFTTQINEAESETCSLPPINESGTLTSRSSTSNTPRSKKSRDRHGNVTSSSGVTSSRRGNSHSSRQSSTSNLRSEDKKRVNNKNFIARNKELAHDASSAIAMTEQEKQRLNELLSDIDLEVPLEKESETSLATIFENGFRPSNEEEERLKEIESRLIIEEGSALSICSGQTNNTLLSIQSSVISEINDKCKPDDKLGEAALKTLNEKRSEAEKLVLIDEMLAKLGSDNQEDLPEIQRSTLDELLSQCRAETARASEEPSDLVL